MSYLIDDEIELRTERLALRTLDPSFAARYLDFIARNKDFLKEWEPVARDSIYTLEFQEEKLRAERALRIEDRALRLSLFKQTDHAFERIIGEVAFSNIVRGAFQSCHLGYKIDGAEANSGYMTEALARAIRFAFEDMLLHRIEANIMPKNARSIRVVEKLGFVNEGRSPKYLKIAGAWEDHFHFVLLNPAME